MNKCEIKRFVEDHKRELIAGAVVIGGVVLTIVGVKCRTKRIDIKVAGPNGVDIPIPDGFKRWNVDMLWSEASHIASIMEDVPIDDLGELPFPSETRRKLRQSEISYSCTNSVSKRLRPRPKLMRSASGGKWTVRKTKLTSL